MKEETFRIELKVDGYSKEEQYFSALNFKLRKLIEMDRALTLTTNATHERLLERAIERWETDGGSMVQGAYTGKQ